MPEPAMLDYFYGDEAEQYTFYRIPKVLFTDPAYRRISSDAKILYGLMLDRMGLSVRNGWLDDCQRVFIYFTLEDALEYLCCGHTKAVLLFGELDKNGYPAPYRRRTAGKETGTASLSQKRLGVLQFCSASSFFFAIQAQRSHHKFCGVRSEVRLHSAGGLGNSPTSGKG